MYRNQNKSPAVKPVKSVAPLESQFAEVSSMILAARQKAFRAVDAALVELYWNIGRYISKRVTSAEWGGNG